MSNDFNFLKWSIVTCAVVLAASATFNYVINPYNLFISPELPGINTSKAGAGDRIAFSKTYMAGRTRAETVILGTSKFDIGLDPGSSYVPEEYRPAFNFSVPGASLYDLYRYLQHISARHKPKLVIIELEFETFLSPGDEAVRYPPDKKEFEERLLVNFDGTVNSSRFTRMLKDYSAALLSNAAIYDSYRTILSGDAVWLDDNGLSSDELRFGSEVRNKGHFSVFRDTIRIQLDRGPERKMRNDSVATRALEDILAYGRNNQIQLVFILPPIHAYQYEFWQAVGLWGEFEKWKRLLVEKIDTARSEGDLSVSLWDYAWYNDKTTEDVPAPHDLAPMTWYWEPVHFKRELGTIILKEVLTGSDDPVGVQLTSGNICRHLMNVRRLKQDYENKKTEQMARFRKIVTENDLALFRPHEVKPALLNCP